MRFIPFSFPRENISRIFHLTFHFTFHLNVHLAFSPHFSTENPAFVFENSRRIHCAVPPRVECAVSLKIGGSAGRLKCMPHMGMYGAIGPPRLLMEVTHIRHITPRLLLHDAVFPYERLFPQNL